jgi:hypothetical protein
VLNGFPVWKAVLPRVVPDRCTTTLPSRHAQCGHLDRSTRRGYSQSLFSFFILYTHPANASLDNRSDGAIQKGNTSIYSILLAWASALFQMMNLLCIVPLLSLPGRLPILCSSGRLGPLVPRRRRTCACSAWQSRLGRGLHLQSDSTLALERTSQ